MTTEYLKELVTKSDFSQVQKNMMNGFIERAKSNQESNKEDRLLIEQVANVHTKH